MAYLRPSLPLNAKNCYGLFEHLWRGLAAGCHSKNIYTDSLIVYDFSYRYLVFWVIFQRSHFKQFFSTIRCSRFSARAQHEIYFGNLAPFNFAVAKLWRQMNNKRWALNKGGVDSGSIYVWYVLRPATQGTI